MKRLMILIVVAILVVSGVAQAGTFQTEMVSLSLSGDLVVKPIEIRKSSSLPSPGYTVVTDLGGGWWQVDSFFDVRTKMSIDSGPFMPGGPKGTMVTRLVYETSLHMETTSVEVEVLDLFLTGKVMGNTVSIRIDPSLTQPGNTTISNLGDGVCAVDSFFDVFTEIRIGFTPWRSPGLNGPVRIKNTLPHNEFKWLQVPDIQYGYDIWSWGYEDSADTVMIVNEVADDWRCPDGRPITDIHWWGSFKGWMEDTPAYPATGMSVPDTADLPLYFILSMHEDVPAGADTYAYIYSSPGDTIQKVLVYPDQGQVGISYYDSNPIIDHATGEPVTGRWEHEYEFFVDLEALGETWDQTQGEIYWLDIVAIYPEPPLGPDTPKWSQFPDINYGYDIPAWGRTVYSPVDGYVLQVHNQVADDWLCTDGKDITRIRWWGSFDDWSETDPAPVDPPPPSVAGPPDDFDGLPVNFILSMHEDVPAGADTYSYIYSSPGDTIQTISVSVSQVSINWFDVNPKIDHETGETISGMWEHEYEFEVTLEEPWPQTAGNIYWLDILATYYEYPIIWRAPDHYFGWKTADPTQPPPGTVVGWIDDAVSSINPLWPIIFPPMGHGYPTTNWYEMVYGPADGSTNPITGLEYAGGWSGYTGQSVNMSFELFTAGDPVEPAYVFGWKTADPTQTPPDTVTGSWIDDAVSSNDPWDTASIAKAVPYPPISWYEMVYGPMNGISKTTNNLFYSGGWSGYMNQSVGMAFGLTTLPPTLIIENDPADTDDAILIPTIDPTIPFSIWYNYNMVDLNDTSWSLLGNYPAGTTNITDTGALTPNAPPRKKFYILQK